MKKSLIVMIGLIFVSGLIFSQIPRTTEDEPNLAEEVLAKQAETVMDFILASGVPDRKLSNAELHTLDSMVENFFNARENLFKGVKDISFLSLVKEEHHFKFLFVFECREVLDVYFPGLTEEDDKNQTLKRFFEKHTGYQIDIETKNLWVARIIFFILIGFLVGGLLGVVVSTFSDSDLAGIITSVVIFVVIGILFLFVFR